MKKIISIFFLVALGSATTSYAQLAKMPGHTISEAASLLDVAATQPFRLQPDRNVAGQFRLIFRVSMSDRAETEQAAIPFITVGEYDRDRRSVVFQWIAFTSQGARCWLSENKVNGIGVFSKMSFLDRNLDALRKTTDSEWVVRKSNPFVISADFYCDSPVEKDDSVTAQIKFYVFNGRKWDTADYLFENLTVSN